MFEVSRWLGLGMLVLLPVLACAESVQIKTMSQRAYPAKYDPSTPAKPGICLEIIRAVEKTDPGIKFAGLETMASTSRVIDHLAYGDIEVFFGLLKTSQRLVAANYIDPPLFSVSQVLLVRRDDPVQVNSWDEVRNMGRAGSVLAVANSGQAVFLRKQGGLVVDDQAFTVEANLNKLLAGRGRFIYVSENNVRAGIESLGIAEQVKILRPPFLSKDSLHVAFSKRASPDIVKRIVVAIRKLERTGEMKKIRERYQVE